MRYPFAVILCATLLACAGSQQAVIKPLGAIEAGADVAALRAEADAAWENRMVESELRGAIDRYEAVYSADQENGELLDRIMRAYYLLGYAYTSDKAGKIELHERGRQFGLKRLELHEGYRAVVQAGGSMRDAVGKIEDPAYVHALLFTASNWGWWAEQKGISTVAFDIPKVRALFERAIELNADYMCSGPRLMAAAFFAKAGTFGGDMNKARAYYEEATLDPQCTDNKVMYAEFYAIPTDDRALFNRLLTEVLVTDVVPDHDFRVEQRIAREKAEALLAREEHIFF